MCVDKLWDKYYSLTPYHYSGNNPVSLLDGNGLLIEFIGNSQDKKYSEEKFNESLNYLMKNGANEAANRLIQLRDDPSFTVKFYADNSGEGYGDNQYNSISKTLFWNPEIAVETSNADLTPAEVLAHEVDHALQDNTNSKKYEHDKKTNDKNYSNKEEKRVNANETKTAKQLKHLKKENKPSRKNHEEGVFKKVDNVGTNK